MNQPLQCLIGSKALAYHFPDFYRKCKDYDYIVNDNRTSTREVEYHWAKSPGHEWILQQGPIASPEILLTIKMSHSFWDVHWEKTMDDILFLQRKKIEYIPELFEQLYQYWIFVHGEKKANLNKDNTTFFEDSVQRKYIHDDIHKVIAYYDEPLYTRIKTDKNKANVSHQLFLQLSKEDQLKLCREEIYVTALERFIIPHKESSSKAYFFACKQLLISMTRGWFPKYIVENWHLLHRPVDNFVAKFNQRISGVRLCPK